MTYVKRKVVKRFDQYKLESNKAVLMLYGKGDSVALDENN